MLENVRSVGASVVALLLASAATSALAAGQVVIVTDSSQSSEATGLQARLIAAGYEVTLANNTAALAENMTGVAQVWDVRYNTALSGADSTTYLSYLHNAGGLFLIGENASFAARNNSLFSFISAAVAET